MTQVTQKQLDLWFTHHSPGVMEIGAYDTIRQAGKKFAQAIIENTPPGEDQVAAIRKIREAVMTANAAIACE